MKIGKFEHRRQRLLELLDTPPFAGRGGQAKLAKIAGKDSSYVSRLTWEATRKGSKKMGEELVEAIEDGCDIKGWFDADTGTSREQLRAQASSAGRPAAGDEFAGMSPADLARTIARLSEALARMLVKGKP